LCENPLTEALMARGSGDAAVFSHLGELGGYFAWKWLLMRVPAVLGGCGIGYEGGVREDYALIAASRGWTPMMFMTRVRL
jgi:hypothetical protein